MTNPVKIPHPLRSRTGASQRRRVLEALKPGTAPVDGRSLTDILYFISQYATQVNFFEVHQDDNIGEYLEASDWRSFFDQSAPFQLARLSKVDASQLEAEFLRIQSLIQTNPLPDNIDLLLRFILSELIQPVTALHQLADATKNTLAARLAVTVKTTLFESFQNFAALHNAANVFLCTTKISFLPYTAYPWQLGINQAFYCDPCVPAKGNRKKAARLISLRMNDIFYPLLAGFKEIQGFIPDYLEESLTPLEADLQQKHEPHLALLFAFLDLFKYFQGDLNQLGQKHLDFFYKEVLSIVPKKAVPDKAHLVFEIAKHLEQYKIKKDTLFLDGKDSKNQDIRFGLEEEVVVDKASVADLRTLHLYPSKIGSGIGAKTAVEGVYIAPIANSADGKGKKFDPQNSANWTTLGAKYSKFIPEGKDIPLLHPYGRIGFVLASPVLYLNEGKRKITVKIQCPTTPNDPIQSDCDCFFKFKESLKQTFYSFNKNSIDNLNTIFSVRAKKYLEEKLQIATPWVIADFKDEIEEALWTNSDGTTTNLFTEKEVERLECLTNQPGTSANVLQEMPFTTVTRHLLDLLKGHDYYEIGFQNDLNAFFNAKDNVSCKPIFYPCLKELILKNNDKIIISTEVDKNFFSVKLSGKDDWIVPNQLETKFEFKDSDGKSILCDEIDPDKNYIVVISIEITLNQEDPAVVFYDEEKLKEKIDLKMPFPLMKVELNSELQAFCETGGTNEPHCCLEEFKASKGYLASIYHFLRYLRIIDVKIDVSVCGVKNLIVQNDDNLQSVNSPILPFGARPNVGEDFYINGGSNFYIGSKEIWCKNWQQFWIKTEWQDKPQDLGAYYQFYAYGLDFEDSSNNITNDSFKFLTAVLDDGIWKPDTVNIPNNNLLKLFGNNNKLDLDPCGGIAVIDPSTFRYYIKRGDFGTVGYKPKSLDSSQIDMLKVDTLKAFIKLTLAGVSFQHTRYTFVLSQQLMTLAGLINPISLITIKNDISAPDGAVALTNAIIQRNSQIKTKISDIIIKIGIIIHELTTDFGIMPNTNLDGVLSLLNELDVKLGAALAAVNLATATPFINDAQAITAALLVRRSTINTESSSIQTLALEIQALSSLDSGSVGPPIDLINDGIEQLAGSLSTKLNEVKDLLIPVNNFGLPKEPYTPTIKRISIDYEAIAEMNDIDLVHLYPFEQTSKFENLETSPTLLPTFTDEGTLFIGLKDLRPGANLNLLLQLAEATADSERNRAVINWNYLTGNRWLQLRTGFELIDDQSDGITVSGIVQFSIPEDISDKGNTIMPEGVFWIKASAPENTAAISEVIGIHAQAALSTAILTPVNDLMRLDKALDAGSIAKLAEADFSVKSIAQPYQSFGGKRPEEQGSLYTRVSERLRHKDRGIQLYDFEHLILEAFPQIYKTKCISHSIGLSTYDYRRDLEVAPGFVELVVIPDLTKLIPGSQLEPRAPVSLLEQIADFLRKRISPFARLKVLNPRYEKVNVNISVQLVRGKSKAYYAQQLKEDLTRFLAPWYLGDSDKIVFGQTLRFSEVVGFVESLDYIENIQDINLNGPCAQTGAEIKAMTARSILTGGEICVSVVDEDCKPCVITKTRINANGISVKDPQVCENQPVRFLEKKKA